MHLKFSEKYLQNARIQLNSHNEEDVTQLNEVNNKTDEINELNNYNGIKNIGYKDFINNYPHSTVICVENNKS